MTVRHPLVIALALLSACGTSGPESGRSAAADAPLAARYADPAAAWEPPIGNAAGEEYRQSVQPYNLPEWVRARAAREGHTRTLVPALHLNPFYQSGDFDGDGRLDVAVLVSRHATGEWGILLVHGGATASVLVGAGVPFGNGGTSFHFMSNWMVHPGSEDDPGDALEVIKLESARGLIYWHGGAYRWRQIDD